MDTQLSAAAPPTLQAALPRPGASAARTAEGRGSTLRRIGRMVHPGWAAAAGLVAVALAASPFLARHDPDPQFLQVEQTLSALRQTDIRWTVSVLSLEIGLAPNYDALTGPAQLLRAAPAELAAARAGLSLRPEEVARLDALTRDLGTATAQKIDLAGRIASHYAIISNSARFLPTAVNDLLLSLSDASVPPDTASQLRDLAARIGARIASGMLREDAAQQALLRTELKTLTDLAPTLPPAVAPRAAALATHGAIVAEQRRSSNETMLRLISLPTERLIDELRGGYAQARDRAREQLRFERSVVIGLAALLAALVAYLGWQMGRSYRELRRSNRELISANDEAQMQLLQSAKMSAMGQLIAGIAHEINTPLAYIKATFSILQELLQKNATEAVSEAEFARRLQVAEDGQSTLFEEINGLLEDGLHGTERIAALVLAFKNFSRIDRAQSGNFSLPEIIEGVLLISSYQLKHVAEVEKDYEPVPDIACRPSQISQVILNLITNAVHAMAARRDRGLIHLRLRQEDANIRLDVTDNGCGIPADILPSIFDPFFTTKQVGEGTGLGLSICYRIVSNHGGRLLVRSEVGIGTTFSLILPIHPPAS